MQEKLDIQTENTNTGWVLTYKIPFALIRRFFSAYQPKVGLQVCGNAYKCGVLTAQPPSNREHGTPLAKCLFFHLYRQPFISLPFTIGYATICGL